MALWDIAGRTSGQPVYRLLGATPEVTHGIGRRLVGEGFMAVKFGWGSLGRDEAGGLALVRAARRGIGDGAEPMIDAGLAHDAVPALRRAERFAERRPC